MYIGDKVNKPTTRQRHVSQINTRTRHTKKKKKEGLTVLFVSELTHAELWTGLTFQMFTSKHKAPWLPG